MIFKIHEKVGIAGLSELYTITGCVFEDEQYYYRLGSSSKWYPEASLYAEKHNANVLSTFTFEELIASLNDS